MTFAKYVIVYYLSKSQLFSSFYCPKWTCKGFKLIQASLGICLKVTLLSFTHAWFNGCAVTAEYNT